MLKKQATIYWCNFIFLLRFGISNFTNWHLLVLLFCYYYNFNIIINVSSSSKSNSHYSCNVLTTIVITILFCYINMPQVLICHNHVQISMLSNNE